MYKWEVWGGSHAFLFKSGFSTVEGLRQFLFTQTVLPALENTLSQATEDAGVPRYWFARSSDRSSGGVNR